MYYAVFAFFGGIFSSKYEVFPIFNWSLFTYVSDVRNFCEIEVTSIDGVSVKPPTRFYDLPDEFAAARTRSATVFKLLQKTCRAQLAGQEDAFEAFREVLESSYLADREEVHYRLVIQTYNPIERWRDGSVIATELLGEYRTGRYSD